ncbi:MAG: o-succinylbenzoate synthase [Thaumarchaeota archaeon]|nr:o-succinylbenzoate synthase [Nitrososphaerota archaeon]
MSTLTINLVRLPLLSRFKTSFGTETQRCGLILRLRGDGIAAYSECVASSNPYYSYEDNDTALHIIRDHLGKVARGLPSPGEFLERASTVKGHNMAKAAVEMLLWDFHSKRKMKPLHKVLGESKGHAEVGISLGIDRTGLMVKRVGEALKRGYKRIKVKIEKGKEYEIVRAVRASFPEIPLSADANACYSVRDVHLLRRLDRFNLLYLEQPLDHDDLIYHARLRKEISTPICLDESISSVDKALKAFEVGAADVVNIKPGRIGGLTNSLEVIRIVRKNKGHVWIGGMLETGIGRSFNIALASHRLVDYAGDTAPNEMYFERDIVKNPFVMDSGIIRPNTGPGIGIEIDERFLEKMTIRSWAA